MMLVTACAVLTVAVMAVSTAMAANAPGFTLPPGAVVCSLPWLT